MILAVKTLDNSSKYCVVNYNCIKKKLRIINLLKGMQVNELIVLITFYKFHGFGKHCGHRNFVMISSLMTCKLNINIGS